LFHSCAQIFPNKCAGIGPLAGSTQSRCLPSQPNGTIACNWARSYALSVPSSWTSGVYLGLLTNATGYTNYLMFVVKDGRPAPLRYQQSVLTYQAYNNWPDDKATGKSLYSFNSYGALVSATGDVRAAKVSFDRPYTAEGAGQFLFWEIQFIRWLERSGYDVTYSTDIDTHTNGAALRNSKGFLAVGHDEYWTKEMYDAAQAARDAGIHEAYFGGNDVYWQVRLESSGGGVANRVEVCYKDGNLDPVKGPTATVNWRTAPANRPEQGLMGVQYTSQTSWGSNVDYVVTNSGNWTYNGTGFRDGDHVPGIVGYEMDKFFSTTPEPANSSRTILSQSPFTNVSAQPDYANSSIYQAPGGAWVFAAGTMSWSWGLDNYYQDKNLTDARIQRTSANILDRFVAAAPPPLQVSAVQASGITQSSAVITWQTNNSADSRVNYGTTTAYGSAVSDPTLVTGHSMTLSGLTTNTTYHYQVVSVDGLGQTASSADATFTTSSAPPPPLQLSAVQAGSITASSAVITWQSSNAANSRADYGTTPSFGSAVTDPTLVTSHSLTLSGLAPGTWYRYKVTSVDGYGQSATSPDAFFQTSSAQNLVLNPGFESGSAYWQLDASSSIDTNPANAHTGNNSLKLNALLAWQGSAQYVSVTPGLSYTYGGWERGTSSTASSGYITLASYDANWVQLGSTSLTFASTGTWSSLTGTYVPPAGTVRVGIYLQNDGAGTFWFDDLSLTQP